MPSLRDAYLRVDRAREHLEAFKNLHDRVCAAQADATIVHVNANVTIGPNESGELLRVQSGQTAIPDEIPLLIVEWAHHLRAALDYLVHELAWLDSGARVEKTQFPIDDTQDGFRKHRRRYLAGLNDAHVAAIEELQPYNGCNWARSLRDLCNMEKHRKLVLVAHDVLISMTTTEDATDGGDTGMQMDVELRPVLRITLDDGTPIVEELDRVQANVIQALDAFNPEFEV